MKTNVPNRRKIRIKPPPPDQPIMTTLILNSIHPVEPS